MDGPRRAQAPAGPLAGKTFVVTGTLDGFSRESIAEHLAGLGAKVTTTVSTNTDYLLAGAGGGSKRAKAEQLGVTVISEAELEQLVASGGG
jgi:DNA ligase (NAD+)